VGSSQLRAGERGRAAAKELKNGEIVVFEDSGHWPHYEEQDAFHAKVLEFLQS